MHLFEEQRDREREGDVEGDAAEREGEKKRPPHPKFQSERRVVEVHIERWSTMGMDTRMSVRPSVRVFLSASSTGNRPLSPSLLPPIVDPLTVSPSAAPSSRMYFDAINCAKGARDACCSQLSWPLLCVHSHPLICPTLIRLGIFLSSISISISISISLPASHCRRIQCPRPA